MVGTSEGSPSEHFAPAPTVAAPFVPQQDVPTSSGAPVVQPVALVPLLPPIPRAEGLSRDWPLQDVLELGALVGSVPCARYHARQIAAEWGLARLRDDVELVTSELVTNAVSASRKLDWPLPVRMWLLSDRADLLIEVWDASPMPPVPIDPAGDAEVGRGLLIVDAISTRWDWYGVPDPRGKVVWALLAG
jgi:anti-sigma regulatory factor (Ser/Thr protein kinase)